VNELYGLSVGLHSLDLKEAGQFEEHGSLAAVANIQLQGGIDLEFGGRLDSRLDLVLRHVDRLRPGFFSQNGGRFGRGPGRLTQGE